MLKISKKNAVAEENATKKIFERKYSLSKKKFFIETFAAEWTMPRAAKRCHI